MSRAGENAILRFLTRPLPAYAMHLGGAGRRGPCSRRASAPGTPKLACPPRLFAEKQDFSRGNFHENSVTDCLDRAEATKIIASQSIRRCLCPITNTSAWRARRNFRWLKAWLNTTKEERSARSAGVPRSNSSGPHSTRQPQRKVSEAGCEKTISSGTAR